jgi:hypothetical protein
MNSFAFYESIPKSVTAEFTELSCSLLTYFGDNWYCCKENLCLPIAELLIQVTWVKKMLTLVRKLVETHDNKYKDSQLLTTEK